MRQRAFPDYPVWVEVDLERFCGNLRAIRAHLPGTCEVVNVLKSDAYGHGTVELAKAAQQEGLLGRIGIATNEEARWLREAGFDFGHNVLIQASDLWNARQRACA